MYIIKYLIRTMPTVKVTKEIGTLGYLIAAALKEGALKVEVSFKNE